MTIVVDLPQELETKLSAEAADRGVPLQDYLVQILSQGLSASKKLTGSELVDYWQDQSLIGVQPGITDSQQHARNLRNQAELRE